ERLQEREAVARGAVAEAVAFLVPVGAGAPDELGASEHKVLVEVVRGAGDDTGRARAELKTDPTVARPLELGARRAGPVGEPVLAERMSRENGRALVGDGIVGLVAEQSECVSGHPVERAEAAIVVVLPPQPVAAATLPQRGGRLACSLIPPALIRPFAHRQS